MATKKLFNIVLALLLLLASAASYELSTCCGHLEAASKKCCSGQPAENACCVEMSPESQLHVDWSYYNNSNPVPDPVATIQAYSAGLIPAAVLHCKHSLSIYSPPVIIKDISVVNRVFRI